jgi:hypothetical protein
VAIHLPLRNQEQVIVKKGLASNPGTENASISSERGMILSRCRTLLIPLGALPQRIERKRRRKGARER